MNKKSFIAVNTLLGLLISSTLMAQTEEVIENLYNDQGEIIGYIDENGLTHELKPLEDIYDQQGQIVGYIDREGVLHEYDPIQYPTEQVTPTPEIPTQNLPDEPVESPTDLNLEDYGIASTIRILNLDAFDIVYDGFSQRIYASVGSADDNYGNSITIIDPLTGVIEESIYVGSEPQTMAISEDGKYIYVALDGSGKISRFDVASRFIDYEFLVGTSDRYGPLYAEDIEVQPGNPDVIAVSMIRKSVTPRHGGVAVFENGVMLPQKTRDHTGSNVIEFSDSPGILYGYNNASTEYGLRTMVVNAFGVEIIDTKRHLVRGFYHDIEYERGHIYSTSGHVLNTPELQLVGAYETTGKIEPDSQIRRTFFINGSTIRAYHQNTFTLSGQLDIAEVNGEPRNLIRWGQRGLAFSTDNERVYIVETDLVVDIPTITNFVIDGPDHITKYSGEYKLFATFSDGIMEDLTSSVVWSCHPNTFTEIDSNGIIFISGTDEPGTVTIRAEFDWGGHTYETTKNVSYEGTILATGNLTRLEIAGANKVMQNTATNYRAIAHFDDGSEYDVTNKSIWGLSSADFAAVDINGVLTVTNLDFPRNVVLSAKFGHQFSVLGASKLVYCFKDVSQFYKNDWPMFQADAQHTGYLPIRLNPWGDFSLRWEKQVSDYGLNPVTAVGDKVFVSSNVYFHDVPSLFTLDAKNGEILWSKYFGDVHSVNPPSYGYGKVYVQVVNHRYDTYLYAFDADSGSEIFKSPFWEQWGRYTAPTIYENGVYINGGYYGGMYGFDAHDGSGEWFIELYQDDGWTPAVAGDHAYAYIGGLLSAVNRFNGLLDYTIDDDLARSGGSLRGTSAPVIGEQGNILVINNKRLVSFDLPNKRIGWEIFGEFYYQPSVANGVVYAINGGSVDARDETTGSLLWTWRPPEGSLTGTMIITDRHLIGRTSSTLYAIELLTQHLVLSYPASGHLTLANETLYVADSEGKLTAITIPEFIPAKPDQLIIEGPAEIMENSTAQYTVTVSYRNGRIRERTYHIDLMLIPSDYATIDDSGLVTTKELSKPIESIVLLASYTENGETVQAFMPISIMVNGDVPFLIDRNISGALKYNQEALDNLSSALRLENDTSEIISDFLNKGNPQLSKWKKLNALLNDSIVKEKKAGMKIIESIVDLKSFEQLMNE